MAKKSSNESKGTAKETVASKAAAKVAEDILKKNPEIKEVYVTSDGTAFYTRNDAQNHANGLKNREVMGFKRSTVVNEAAKKESAAAKVTATDHQGAGEVDELTGEQISEETTKGEE